MRSPMIEASSYITDKEAYSDLQVLESNAEFYIGTEWRGQPGTRDSGYYATWIEAEADLAKLEANPNAIPLRMHP